MKKRVIILLAVLAVVLIVGISYYYYFGLREEKSYEGGSAGAGLANPAEGLSVEEAAARFDESFVYYLLISIGASDLSKPIFGSNPKINLYVGDDIFSAEVIRGSVNVDSGEIEGEDIIIRTSKEEGAKMVLDRDYIKESFRSGQSSAELVAGKLELAAKGYLKIYDELS